MFAVFLNGFNVSTDADQFKIKTGKIQHNFEVGKSNKLLPLYYYSFYSNNTSIENFYNFVVGKR